jgi:hypothetical protein
LNGNNQSQRNSTNSKFQKPPKYAENKWWYCGLKSNF